MPPVTICSNRCNVCFFANYSSPKCLLLCSRCELIRYCGRDHQLIDWPIHKDFCKAVAYLKKTQKVEHLIYLNGPIKSRKDFEHATVIMNYRMRLTLRRDLENFEQELLNFPKVCNTCFSHKVSVNHDCGECGVVSYCCAEHKQTDLVKHRKECYYLRVCYNFFDFEDFSMTLDFQQAVDLKSENHLFDALTKSCANKINIPKKPETLEDYQSYFKASNYSCTATILYSLRVCNASNPSFDRMTLFIVGAKDEHNWFHEEHLHFLFSQSPGLKNVKIYFIGPELMCYERVVYNFHLNQEKRKAELQFHAKTFEEFLEGASHESEDLNKPDLIACFNCGFSEFSGMERNTWKTGIEKILEFNSIPILFTSYTLQEASLDLKEVIEVAMERNIPYEVVVRGKENAYKDYRPFRNWRVSETCDPIYFRNGYLHVVISKEFKR